MVKSESFSGVNGQSDSSSPSETVTVQQQPSGGNGTHAGQASGDTTLVPGDDTCGEDSDDPPPVPSLAFRLGPEAGSVTANGNLFLVLQLVRHLPRIRGPFQRHELNT